MSEDQNKFLFVIQALLSTDNDIRKQAEETYATLPPESKIVFLMNIIQDAGRSVEERQMSAVLLRKIFSTDFIEIYSKFLFQCANSDNTTLKESALRLFTSVPEIFGNQESTYLVVIKQMLQQCLLPPNPYSVQAQAVKSIFAFLPDRETSIQKQLSDLLPSIFQVIVASVEQEDESLLKSLIDIVESCPKFLRPQLDPMVAFCIKVQAQAVKSIFAFLPDRETSIQKQLSDLLPSIFQVIVASVEQEDESLLKSLIDIVESCPKFLRPQLDPMVAFCIKVFENDTLEDSLRHLGLEVIVSLSETAAPMFRKEAGKYLQVLVPLILKMMTNIDEDDKWGQADEVVEDDNESNTVVAETGLDRLACGIGGKTILPIIMNTVPDMLANPDWKYRVLVPLILKMMTNIDEDDKWGQADEVVEDDNERKDSKYLQVLVPLILKMMTNIHEDDKWGQADEVVEDDNESNAPDQKRQGKVIPGLLMLLDDVENPQIQAHAGAALVNFSEDCPKHILLSYLNGIMEKLKEILNSKFKELLAKGTKLVLEQVVTTIASVADTSEEQFTRYYDELMPALKYIITNATPPEYRLLRGKCDHLTLALVDNDDMEDVGSDADWQFVSLGEQQNFGIKTAGLEDKAAACEMLVCYARELKEGFAEYSGKVIGDPEARTPDNIFATENAISAVTKILKYRPAAVPNIDEVIPHWLNWLPIFSDTEECPHVYGLLCDLIEANHPLVVGAQNANIPRLIALFMVSELIHAFFLTYKTEFYPHFDNILHHFVSELIHAFFLTYKTEFYPHFDNILHHFVRMLQTDQTWSNHQWGLCIFDDLIEFTGPDSAKYESQFLAPMVSYITDICVILSVSIQGNQHGKTIECVSLIALAVGTDKFLPDSDEIMQLLLQTHPKGQPVAEDDPQTSYLITAWARICK
ncbi:importin-5-like, partial [Diaphorina citri]|uniref:Importin-5-like n=1 Tax=Diaphorina citri TaxID=121845 RepID=A0A3Q0JIN1_DIACI